MTTPAIAPPLPELTCEVCKQEAGVGVACIPGIPMSVPFGRACLIQRASPYWAIRANIACCGGPDQVHPDYLESMTYVDGKYMPIKAALALYPMTREEINFGPSDSAEI
jgi:hypothetical protein